MLLQNQMIPFVIDHFTFCPKWTVETQSGLTVKDFSFTQLIQIFGIPLLRYLLQHAILFLSTLL